MMTKAHFDVCNGRPRSWQGMVQRQVAVVVSVWGPQTSCGVRLEKELVDERASTAPVGAIVGPIAEPQ